MESQDRSTVIPDPGSFRDPLSRVLHDGDRVLREVREPAGAALDRLFASATWARHVAAGTLLDATEVPGAPEGTRWFEHPRIAPWSDPCEWTFSMLRDATLLQLDLLRDALADGLMLKDASAFNVVFRGSRPVFVDLGSFDIYRPGEPWRAYQQMCRHLLFPLLIQARAGVDLQPLLRASLEGVDATTTRALLPTRTLARRGVAVHVLLQAFTEGRLRSQAEDLGTRAAADDIPLQVLLRSIAQVRDLVDSLRWEPKGASVWSDYTERGHYLDEALAAKESFVRRAVVREHRRLVLDVGCNDGRFSRIAAEWAESVVAVDTDHLTVDRLYRELRDDPAGARILPLVVDVADPTPARGWVLGERASFPDRARPDLILALAVVHHLVLAGHVPVEAVLDAWAATGADLVVELPTEDDPMVARLLRTREEGRHHPFDRAGFEAALHARYEVRDTLVLAGGTRVIYDATPRPPADGDGSRPR